MPPETSKILSKMLDRLFAAMANGPSLNCKPHSSRQRIDLIQFAKLKDRAPAQILIDLLGENHSSKVISRVPPPPRKAELLSLGIAQEEDNEKLTPQEKAAKQEWSDQQSLMGKLRTIAEDAKGYENDTGVHVLHIGYPLLSLPPGSFGLQRSFSRRILAPVAFISVTLSVRAGAAPAVLLECKNQGEDLVVPNTALLAWLEQQTGEDPEELFVDETGQQPWKEISVIVQRVAKLVEIDVPGEFTGENVEPPLKAAPRMEEDPAKPTIIPSAILGLFPMANQGLLRDMQALAAGEPVSGPLESFLNVQTSLVAAPAGRPAQQEVPARKEPRVFAEERLVTHADPCQSRAVKLARTCRGLVVHGPPGTGKSQTIANVIGDHLSRGQRVLMVCDKRTALDVVMYRLEALGLGQLCAVVHDPQRDQRELYKAVREQLDALSEAKTYPHAHDHLRKVGTELQALHRELREYHAALMDGQGHGGTSFHELMGQWLQLPSYKLEFREDTLKGVSPDDLEAHARQLGEVFERAELAAFAKNPWASATKLPLKEFLATPMDRFRETMHNCLEAAGVADATIDPAVPPFAADLDLARQANKRAELADPLSQLVSTCEPAVLTRWARADAHTLKQQRQKIQDVAALLDTVKAGPLETELLLAVRSALPNVSQLGQQIACLEQYLAVGGKWYGFLCVGKKSGAQRCLTPYGLPLSMEAVGRLKAFLTALRARTILSALHQELLKQPVDGQLVPDEALIASFAQHQLLFATLQKVHEEPELVPLKALAARALCEPAAAATILDGLRRSPARAAAIEPLEKALAGAGLLRPEWVHAFSGRVREGHGARETVKGLAERLPTLEHVLRVREGIASLPQAIGSAAGQLVKQHVGKEPGLVILKKAVLSNQIVQRLKSDANLQAADAQKLKNSFERYRLLDGQKKTLVRDQTLHHWVSVQKQRLLAATGTRLNSQGADLRRRLTLRGERAMRLRQVVAVGQNMEGGDPLFDLRPVWMASPETVAQIFPRRALFDVVIFDEASQCRLEEALPVLTRADRVVVAGDPKQLPPTRFFESAVAVSEDQEAESEQELFEVQQSEIEDLLAAALNIEIQECYLDVHYRSRNADLIEFSNQQFYNSRLQSIPGHPSNRSRFAPLTVYKCHGVYDKSCNTAEAEQVCRIVQDLLKRAAPPSIGIASFNIQQRDLILDKLEELAGQDSDFARRLTEARGRRGNGSFDGLFVKNLESVQGDERDHIIISTTYGRNAKGKFYRNFGPLGRAGGGRRLNVLVTRAREEVHLVTSIPESEYRALAPVPAGQTPSGAWLLFSYLAYAEKLAQEYEMNHRLLAQIEPNKEATVNLRPSRWPSSFSHALGGHLAKRHNVGSDVHWGNDGFCVDLALHHPTRADDVTIGVVCDLTRFAQAEDPVEWEVFRTAILESQGWKLHRLWTPHFYRDRHGCTDAILKDVNDLLAGEREKDVIRVVNVEQPQK